MKKRISVLLALMICINLGACGSTASVNNDSAAANGSNISSSNAGTAANDGSTAGNDGSTSTDDDSITGNDNSAAENDGSTNDDQDAENDGQSSAQHYPVTVTTYDYEGNEIETTYEKAPEKVLCVYQGTIETMIALGLEEHVTACYGLDNPVKDEWADGLSKMNYNENVFAPDKETVMLMEPDLIFSWGSIFSDKMLGSPDEWIANGTNTYISTNTRPGGHARTLENEYSDLLNIGRIFHVEDKAQALIDDMKKEISSVLDQTKGQKAPRVSVIEFLDDEISNYGASQLGGDMVTQLGGILADRKPAQLVKKTC